jgi:hypothetical protein
MATKITTNPPPTRTTGRLNPEKLQHVGSNEHGSNKEKKAVKADPAIPSPERSRWISCSGLWRGERSASILSLSANAGCWTCINKARCLTTTFIRRPGNFAATAPAQPGWSGSRRYSRRAPNRTFRACSRKHIQRIRGNFPQRARHLRKTFAAGQHFPEHAWKRRAKPVMVTRHIAAA